MSYTTVQTVRAMLAFNACMVAMCVFGVGHAEDRTICATLSTQSAVVHGDHGYKLQIALQNPTGKPVEIEDYFFGSDMMTFHATAKSDGRELQINIPLVAPGVRPLVISPKRTVIKEVYLESVIPELLGQLPKSDVVVSWTLKVRPNNACFSEEGAMTVTLPRAH